MARTTEVATVPTVVHTNVLSVGGTVVIAVTVIVAMTSNPMPGVTAAIGGIEVGTAEVEVITMRIAQIDAEVPVACLPVEGTVEITGCHEGIPLPVVENITQVQVTALPVGAEHVGSPSNSHQVVEVDLVGGLILLVCQVQFVGHLVGQEQSLVAGLFVTHGVGGDAYSHHHQCEKQLLHNRIVLNCSTFV